MSSIGTVRLVGAGPGDPGLITVRGLEALRNADVVVYDRLSPASLLTRADADAELISAAKSPGSAALTQAEINELLIDRARHGHKVCRLKGGDPFVFGRGGEEAAALRDAGVPFEVIPGVTSAIGAAAYAGIPVTHRGIASSVTIVTGSEYPGAKRMSVDWCGIAQTNGTIVVLMGAAKIGEIANGLIANGRSDEEPVAAIRHGTSPAQITVVGTLANIESRVIEAGLTAPLALVIGDVVKMRDRISWFDTLPLFGKRALVTRARSQASRLAGGLSALGAEVVECPVIKSVPLDDTSGLDSVLSGLNRFDWVAFASPNGVNQVFDRMRILRKDARTFSANLIAAVGPATVDALRYQGIVADLIPDTFSAEGLVAAFRSIEVTPKSAVVFRSDIGRETLPRGLRQLGTKVTEVAAYRTMAAEDSAQIAIRAFEEGVDVTTFTSSSTVRNLVGLLDGDVTGINNSYVACMGPVTAQTANESGIRVDLIPEEQSIPAMISAVAEHHTRGD